MFRSFSFRSSLLVFIAGKSDVGESWLARRVWCIMGCLWSYGQPAEHFIWLCNLAGWHSLGSPSLWLAAWRAAQGYLAPGEQQNHPFPLFFWANLTLPLFLWPHASGQLRCFVWPACLFILALWPWLVGSRCHDRCRQLHNYSAQPVRHCKVAFCNAWGPISCDLPRHRCNSIVGMALGGAESGDIQQPIIHLCDCLSNW